HPVRAFQRNGDISGWRVHPSLIITHKSSAGHERLGTTAGKGEVPSLAKEGWPRHQVNGPVPLEARPGWFVPLPIIGGLNQPPRLLQRRRLRGIFLMGAATPPCPRRGLRLFSHLAKCPNSRRRSYDRPSRN